MGREFSTPAPPSGSISFRLGLFHPFCLLFSAFCFLLCPFCPLVSLLFPINSQLPLRQLLCFDNHANCRGWESVWQLKPWRREQGNFMVHLLTFRVVGLWSLALLRAERSQRGVSCHIRIRL